MRRPWIAGAAALLLAAAPAAAQTDADVLRQAKDRAEIAELMWAYARALDGLDADGYAALYVPDGSFGATRGRDALRKMVADIAKGQAERRARGETVAAMLHLTSNEHIEFLDRDRARVHYYWMTVFAGHPQTQPPRVAAAGRGVDELVRVDGRWRIRSRDVAPKD